MRIKQFSFATFPLQKKLFRSFMIPFSRIEGKWERIEMTFDYKSDAPRFEFRRKVTESFREFVGFQNLNMLNIIQDKHRLFQSVFKSEFLKRILFDEHQAIRDYFGDNTVYHLSRRMEVGDGTIFPVVDPTVFPVQFEMKTISMVTYTERRRPT